MPSSSTRSDVFNYVLRHSEGGVFNGAHGEIALATGHTRHSVYNFLQNFCQAGLLERLARGGSVRGLTYRVLKTVLPPLVRYDVKKSIPNSTVEAARALWEAGDTSVTIATKLGITKNSVIGMARRYDFTDRPSPIRGRVDDPKPLLTHEEKLFRRRARNRRREVTRKEARMASREAMMPATTPPPPRPKPVFVAPVAVAPPPTILLIPPLKGCSWPMWGHHERATHVYCDEPVLKRAGPDGDVSLMWCADHCEIGFEKPVKRKPGGFTFGFPSDSKRQAVSV